MRNEQTSRWNGWAAGLALLVAGCAQVPAETVILGTRVPAAWISRAERGPEAKNAALDWTQAQACTAVSRKLRDTDAFEALRFLRKGAELRDGECCRQYLALVEGEGFNFSQRLYARLFIENLLRQGAIRTSSGSDVTLDLLHQLCWAWRCTEPRSPAKARRALEAMIDRGLTPDLAKSEFLRDLLAETSRGDHAALRRSSQEISIHLAEESADERSEWLQLPSGDSPALGPSWRVLEASAWAGGSDRLLFGTGVLAFLVNERGEPSFRGNHLWIRNCSASPVYYTCSATGQSNHELRPGAEELWTVEAHVLNEHGTTTGIPLTVRYRPGR